MGNFGSISPPSSPKKQKESKLSFLRISSSMSSSNPHGHAADINSHPLSSTPCSPSADEASPETQEIPFTTSCLIVMRHGQRVDEVDDGWEASTSRPWDPPLTPHGRDQSRKAGLRLQGKRGGRSMLIYSSPFKRCLQTAAEVALQNGIGRIHVSFGLCEMLSRIKTAPLNATRVSKWLWGMEDEGDEDWSTIGWQRGGDVVVQGVQIIGIGPSTSSQPKEKDKEEQEQVEDESQKLDPCYPETFVEAYDRFDAEFRRLMTMVHEGQVVLAVTHGDAVGRSVNLCEPNAVVYEVRNAAFGCLSQKLTLIGQEGVEYFVDVN